VADVEGALAHTAEQLGRAPGRQTIAGFSFGSYVGGKVAAADTRVEAFLCIAPVLRHYDYGFLRTARCRLAILAPGEDEFSDREALDRLVASLPRGPWLRVVDTDHLFRTAWLELADACRDAVAWMDGGPATGSAGSSRALPA
jgi:alpha/beta superfamily hydrolase